MTIQFTSLIINNKNFFIKVFFDSDMAFEARDESASEFGAGGCPIVRLAANLAVLACEQQGFGETSDNGWMAGYWYGGAPRDGEGFAVDVLEGEEQAVVTWYTYLPLEGGDAQNR